MKLRMCWLALLGTAAVLSSIPAQAQWVMVARAVSGQVERMENKSKDGSGFDVATVVLMANADKVYQTALTSLQTNHPEVTITSKDPKKRQIKFEKGNEVASMQATPLGDKLTQLVVASNITPAQPNATSVVVDGIMKVCKQMNVVCTLADQ